MHCGNDHLIFELNKEQEYECFNTTRDVRFNPELPAGLELKNGILKGKLTTPLKHQRFWMESNREYGAIWITAAESLTDVGADFESQILYKNTVFPKIRLYPNGFYKNIVVSPQLPQGLEIDQETGILSGKCTTVTPMKDYTITVEGDEKSASKVIKLECKEDSMIPSQGYSICYSQSYPSNSPLSDTYYDMLPLYSCTRAMVPLNYTESYHLDNKHRWPGLDDTIGKRFVAVINGYFKVISNNYYHFRIEGTNGIEVLIDNERVATLGYPGSAMNRVNITSSLETGYHLLTIRYMYSDLFAKLAIWWKSSPGDWILMDHNILNYAGRSPVGVTYNSISTLTSMPINETVQAIYSGPVNSFTVQPDLPSGLQLDLITGSITGSITEIVDKEYTVTAANEFGTCQSKFTILSDTTFLDGLLASYYHVKDDRICQYLKVDPWRIDLISQQWETSINHPAKPKNSWWPSLPSSLFHEPVYATWEGFWYVDTIGEWKMRVYIYDGLRFIIDDELNINFQTCSNKEMIIKRTFNFDRVAYHPIRLEWIVAKEHGFMFIIEVKKPGATDYVPISGDMLKHLPKTSLSASVSSASILLNSELPEGSFHIFGSTEKSASYSINPSLPSTIHLDTSGHISGTFNEVINRTIYTVTAQTSSKTYTTQLALHSYECSPPSFVHVESDDGQTITSILFHIYDEIKKLHIKHDATAAITIAPELPVGLEYIDSLDIIKGKPTFPTETKDYTITSSTESGSMETILSMGVPPCEYGHYFYFKSSGDSFDVHIEKEGHIVFERYAIQTGLYSGVFCIPEDTYMLNIHAGKHGLHSISLYREDKMKYLETRIGDMGWYNVTFATTPTVAPIFNVNYTMISIPVNEEIKVYYEIEGTYLPLYSEPALPEDSQFQDSDRLISVRFKKEGIFTYSINCKNDAGTTTRVLQFNVGMCPPGYLLYRGKKDFSHTDDAVTFIRESTGEIALIQLLDYSSDSNFMYCLLPEPYILKVRCHKTKDTYPRSFFIYNEYNETAATIILDDKPYTDRFELVDFLKEDSEHKVWLSAKRVSRDWYEVDYNEKKWDTITNADLGKFSDNMHTVYYRYHLQVQEKQKVPMMQMKVIANGGFILYVNGVEGIRVNLPLGIIDSDIMAAPIINMNDWWLFQLNGDLFNIGDNIIAIEYHCYATGAPYTEDIIFRLRNKQLTFKTMFLSDKGIAIGSNHTEEVGKADDAFFDKNDYSYWEDSYLPVWLRLTFPDNERRYVNHMILRSYIYLNDQPIQFVVLGCNRIPVYEGNRYIESESKDVLAVINNPYLFDEPKEDVAIPLTAQTSYSSIVIEVHGVTNCTDKVKINNIRLFAQRRYYCPEEKYWHYSVGGSTLYGRCPFLTIGESSRECIVENNTARWSPVHEESCLTRWAKRDEALIDTRYQINNCTLKVWERSVKEAFRAVLVREMTVKEEDVYFYTAQACEEEGSLPAVCVHVRLHPHRLTSQYVKMEMTSFNKNATAIFYRKPMDNIPQYLEISCIAKIRLHQQMSESEIASTVVIALLSIACIALLCLYCKSASTGREKRRKHLSKKNTLLMPLQKTKEETLIKI